MGPGLRAILVRGLVLLVSTLFSLLLLEGLVRLVLPQYSPAGRITYHERDGVPLAPVGFDGRMWKNTGDYDVRVRINRHGFRDGRDLAQSGPADWFVVGDSFSFGHGVEEVDRFSSVLDELLPERVFNIAIPTDLVGYQRLLDYAQARGARIERLIVGLCMENDLLDYDRRRERQAQARPTAGRFRPLRRLKRVLTTQSAAYNAFTAAVHHTPALREAALRVGLVRSDEEALAGKTATPKRMQSTLRELQRLAAAHRPRELLVLVIPSRALWLGDHQAEERSVHGHFVGILAGAGFKVVDMSAVLEREGRPLDHHFQHDGHWNASGHRLAAEAIRACLEDGSGGTGFLP